MARFAPSALILVVGCALSFAAYSAVRSDEQTRLASEFEGIASPLLDAVQFEVASGLATVGALAAFFNSSENVDRGEFATFTAEMLRHQRGVTALSWLPRILDADRVGHESKLQAERLGGYRIRQAAGDGRLVAVTRRPEYYPVALIEPVERNQRALGYDINSDPTRRKALEKARDTGQPVATPVLQLVQSSAPEPGFLVVAPVYRDVLPHDTVAQRRAALMGYVSVVFLVEGLVSSALSTDSPRRGAGSVALDVEILEITAGADEPPGQRRILAVRYPDGASLGSVRSDPDREATSTIPVADRTWKVVVAPAAANGGPNAAGSSLSVAVLLAGLCATATAIPIYESRRRGMARLTELAAALSEQNATLENLADTLSNYLPEQVCRAILGGRHDMTVRARRRTLTISYVDIERFSNLAEALDPSELITIVNDYFAQMSAIAAEYGGTVDKFVGDAMLVFFGDPDSRGIAEDALACARMSVAIQARMASFRERWSERCRECPVHVRITINTGICHVGNIGSPLRMDYTAIGGEVNVAVRLQGIAERDQILLSDATYDLISEQVVARPLPLVRLKGIARDILPYVLTELKLP